MSDDEPAPSLPPAKIEDGKPFPPQREPKPPTPKQQSDAGAFYALLVVVVIVGLVVGFVYCVGSGLGEMTRGLGRPLRHRGRPRLARCRRSRSRTDDETGLQIAGLGVWRRAWRAVRWAAAARAEHASVPAFEHLALQLTALAAPAELIARCHAAAADEDRHARRCFALARAYGGVTWTPDPLPVPSAETADAQQIAVESLLDGCLGEAIAADLARRSAACTTDPVIAETLGTIAEDEARHAELAWDVVAFCIARDRERVVPALAAALDARVRASGPYELTRAEVRATIREHHADVRVRLATFTA